MGWVISLILALIICGAIFIVGRAARSGASAGSPERFRGMIAMVAAVAHALAGDKARAAFWAANVRERSDSLTRQDFFRAFPMKSEPMRARVDRALASVGFR